MTDQSTFAFEPRGERTPTIPLCPTCKGYMARAWAPGGDPYWVCLCCGGGGIKRDDHCPHAS